MFHMTQRSANGRPAIRDLNALDPAIRRPAVNLPAWENADVPEIRGGHRIRDFPSRPEVLRIITNGTNFLPHRPLLRCRLQMLTVSLTTALR